MGFWHTGYIEFHEPTGFGGPYEPPPPRFPCAQCDKIYSSLEELRKHRFETHPLRRPSLYIRGQELGTRSFRVTFPIVAEDVRMDECDRVHMNDELIPVDDLPHLIAQNLPGICKLILTSETGVSAKFTLDFCIASEDHVSGVEDCFERTARGKRLDIRIVEEFITDTSKFGSARDYLGGICHYLYGVLAKEKAPDSSLKYEDYVGKFAKASEKLSAYERPLARTIASVIEFHFNHFGEASRLANEGSRIGQVAARYENWLQNRNMANDWGIADSILLDGIESLVTDWETERILRWAVLSLGNQVESISDMEEFLGKKLPQYDSVKLRILLSEIYSACGDVTKALRHAKTLRNQPEVEQWAESIIHAHTGGRH